MARAFGAPDDGHEYTVSSHRVRTWSELDALLADDKWKGAKGLKVVDVVVGREDVPGKFRGVFERAGEQL